MKRQQREAKEAEMHTTGVKAATNDEEASPTHGSSSGLLQAPTDDGGLSAMERGAASVRTAVLDSARSHPPARAPRRALSAGAKRGTAAIPAHVNSDPRGDAAWNQEDDDYNGLETTAIPGVGSFLFDTAMNDDGSQA
jgi:hypothetical protein